VLKYCGHFVQNLARIVQVFSLDLCIVVSVNPNEFD